MSDPITEAPRDARGLRRASAASFVAAALVMGLASALVASGVEGAPRAAAGALALALGGAGLGALALATPVEPSPTKLVAFACALGLPLGGAAVLLARGPLGGGEAAVAAALAAGAVLALASSVKRLHLAPPGRAAWCAIAIAVACGVGAWGALTSASGLALRAGTPGAVVHATLAAEWLGAGDAPGQPWFAGGRTGLRAGPGLVVAFAAGATGLAPLRACALVCTLCASLLVLGAYLGAAAAGRDAGRPGAGARDLLAALAAVGLVTRALGAGQLADPAFACAVVASGGGALAALHAARSGAMPWPLLACALTASASFAAPAAGVATAAVGAWLASRSGRLPMAVAFALSCAPGLVEARAVGAAGVAPGAPLGPADGAVALAVAAAVLAPAAFAWLHARIAPRVFTAAAAAATLAALAWAAAPLRTKAAELATLAPALVEAEGRLAVADTNQRLRDLRAAFAAIRDADLRAEAPGAALLRWSAGAAPAPDAPPSLTPLLTGLPLWWDRVPPPGAGEEAITSTGERRSDRDEVARALFEQRGGWRARHGRMLAGSAARAGALVAVVTDADRRRTALRAEASDAPDLALRSLGARVLHEGDGVTVYLLAP